MITEEEYLNPIVIKESDVTLGYELLANPHYLGPLLGVNAITLSQICGEIKYEIQRTSI